MPKGRRARSVGKQTGLPSISAICRLSRAKVSLAMEAGACMAIRTVQRNVLVLFY
jgi:hypothetical protein